MTVVFIAAGLYHHISELTDALYMNYGSNFRFFATDAKALESTVIMGREKEMRSKPYYMNINSSDSSMIEANKWCLEADICIIGCGNCEDFLVLRMKTHKLTFKLKERIFKKGISFTDIAYYNNKIDMYYRPYINDNLFYLCIGHYAAHDLYSIGVPKNKLIKWGYYIYKSQSIRNEYKEDDEIKLLWVGRFIEEKRPEAAVYFLQSLLSKGIRSSLQYVGYGPEEKRIKNLVYKSKLNQYIAFRGAKTEVEVRKIMRESDWFLFSSTGWEGWGVVLSEAMLEGMTCFATKCAGASKELILDNYNGILINSDLSDAAEKAIYVAAKGRDFWRKLGSNAKEFMEREYDPSKASSNLIALFEYFYKYENRTPFEKGICSLAEIYDYDE